MARKMEAWRKVKDKERKEMVEMTLTWKKEEEKKEE